LPDDVSPVQSHLIAASMQLSIDDQSVKLPGSARGTTATADQQQIVCGLEGSSLGRKAYHAIQRPLTEPHDHPQNPTITLPAPTMLGALGLDA
jgi:hypothetical protein